MQQIKGHFFFVYIGLMTPERVLFFEFPVAGCKRICLDKKEKESAKMPTQQIHFITAASQESIKNVRYGSKSAFHTKTNVRIRETFRLVKSQTMWYI